ncbi:MAG: alanine--glyoxylate aminotransferase family protein [Armatimonadetes bacterium]|nr:alanine--glyoxylate aminotransferase family protein [Armatimonadota bacterium]
MPESTPTSDYGTLRPPTRVLMGPGPSDTPPRVLAALGLPTVGHLDPAYLELMNQTAEMLRRLFRTQNRLTMPMSGTGSAGMEAAFVNVLEPGDRALVAINGVFGTRMKDIVERCGCECVTVDVEWGQPVPPDAIQKALSQGPFKVVAVVHAETSTGARSDVEAIGRVVKELGAGALFIVDVVTSLGGIPVEVDAWGIDVCYSGTQKCLSCPPGLSPVTFSDRAAEIIATRKTKVQSWYLDLSMIQQYWGEERTYHHTAPINMTYGLNEALRLVFEEGLENRWERHRRLSEKLRQGLAEIGLSLLGDPEYSLPMLNAIVVPNGVDEADVRKRLLNEYNIEIGAGLGPLKGKIWRIGLMGHTAREQNVVYLVAALREMLRR